MDTKSTGRSIFAAISLLLAPIFLAVGIGVMHGHMPQAVFEYFVLHENPTVTRYLYGETYEPDWSLKAFYSLEADILDLEEDGYRDYYKNNDSRMIYYARNLQTGEVITNCEPVTYQGEMTMDEFSLICNQISNGWVEFTRFDGKSLILDDHVCADRFSEQSFDPDYFGMAYKPVSAAFTGLYEIAFAFSEDYAHRGVVRREVVAYTDGEMRYHLGFVLVGLMLLAVGVLFLVLYCANRRGRTALTQAVGKAMHWFPLEIKAIMLVAVAALLWERLAYHYGVDEGLLLGIVLFFLFYLTGCDIWVNRAAFFKRSIVYWVYRQIFCWKDKDGEAGALAKAYRGFKRWLGDARAREQERMLLLPYQKQLYRRLLAYLIGMACCTLAGLFLIDFFHSIIPLLLMLAGMALLSYRLYRRYVGLMVDMERVASQIRLMRSGNFDQKLTLPQDSRLGAVAADLNNLQDGLKNEIDKRMVSEKMKVELITNVSHDLKTPLTSMINYIDLLKEETLEPEHTNAYVKVLDEKSKRLKLLIENIFDISKATSGNMVIHYEKLSMSELVNQTLAECENRLELAELSIKKNYTDEKFYAYADGRMLWRVTENILNNAVKYSMKGTRIYLELTEGEQYVGFTVKNIAGYEMNFTADSITERFVRGDESRATEGTGLGLSIVKSFIEAMGGKMTIAIDGDLFKISICVKKYKENGENGSESSDQ